MLLILWNADCSYLLAKCCIPDGQPFAYGKCAMYRKSRRLEAVLTNVVHLFNLFAANLSGNARELFLSEK